GGEGYKAPVDCGLGSINIAALITSHEPPQDIIAKAGMKSVFTNNADAMASGISVALAGVVSGGGAAAVMSGLWGVVASGIVNTSATAIQLGFSSLCAAFGGGGGYAGTAGAAIGATSWAGVVAAPIAAAVLVIVVGTMEGLKVVEAAKVEPLLKMKLGAA